jgi:hypothetical protein
MRYSELTSGRARYRASGHPAEQLALGEATAAVDVHEVSAQGRRRSGTPREEDG